MGPQELTNVLWRERELLDLLIFKLEEEQLLLTAGKTRWLLHGTREVEQVVSRLHTVGIERAACSQAVAEQWGLRLDAPLSELAAHAPAGPWGEIFGSHLKAMNIQAKEIVALKDSNTQFLSAANRSVQETISGLNTSTGTYTPQGISHIAGGTRLLDQTL